MDSLDEIEKKVAETTTVAVVKKSEDSTAYSAMTMPMTSFMANAKVEDNTVSDEVTQKIQGEVNTALKNDKFVRRKSRKLAKVGDKLVEEEIKFRDNKANARKAQNRVDRQTIKNNLYVAKQEKKRAVKEQRHLNRCQKETHRQEIADYRWKEYGEMLSNYGFKKTPSSFVFYIIVFFDGTARFLDGVNKANNKLIKALKYIIIIGILVGAYFLAKKYFLGDILK